MQVSSHLLHHYNTLVRDVRAHQKHLETIESYVLMTKAYMYEVSFVAADAGVILRNRYYPEFCEFVGDHVFRLSKFRDMKQNLEFLTENWNQVGNGEAVSIYVHGDGMEERDAFDLAIVKGSGMEFPECMLRVRVNTMSVEERMVIEFPMDRMIMKQMLETILERL